MAVLVAVGKRYFDSINILVQCLSGEIYGDQLGQPVVLGNTIEEIATPCEYFLG